MLKSRFTIGNAMYLFMAIGMLIAVIMNNSISLISELLLGVKENFYFRLIGTIALFLPILIVLTSRKYKAIIRVWSKDFPEEMN